MKIKHAGWMMPEANTGARRHDCPFGSKWYWYGENKDGVTKKTIM